MGKSKKKQKSPKKKEAIKKASSLEKELLPKEKKVDVKKIWKEQKDHVFAFDRKGWSIAVILIATFGALGIQSAIDSKMNPETVKASVSTLKSAAREAYKISSDLDIIETELSNRGHYIAPGDTDIDAFSFGVQTNEKLVVLKEVKITKIGKINDGDVVKAKLYEGENVIAEAKIQGGELYFNRFISVLQPETYKEYIVKLDLKAETKPGVRFKLEISSPYDIGLYVDEEPVNSLDTYPLEGAYVTVVGG
ncbi:hypothetical protein ACFL3C_05530 [Patescibacteria group bacterium]